MRLTSGLTKTRKKTDAVVAHLLGDHEQILAGEAVGADPDLVRDLLLDAVRVLPGRDRPEVVAAASDVEQGADLGRVRAVALGELVIGERIVADARATLPACEAPFRDRVVGARSRDADGEQDDRRRVRRSRRSGGGCARRAARTPTRHRLARQRTARRRAARRTRARSWRGRTPRTCRRSARGSTSRHRARSRTRSGRERDARRPRELSREAAQRRAPPGDERPDPHQEQERQPEDRAGRSRSRAGRPRPTRRERPPRRSATRCPTGSSGRARRAAGCCRGTTPRARRATRAWPSSGAAAAGARSSRLENATATTMNPRNHGPIALCVNEWIELTTPDRVRNVPNSERQNARLTSVHVPDPQHPALLLDHHRVEERGRREPRHQRRVLDRIPCVVAAPADLLVRPLGAEELADRRAPSRRRSSSGASRRSSARPSAPRAALPSRTRTARRARRSRGRGTPGGSPCTGSGGSG